MTHRILLSILIFQHGFVKTTEFVSLICCSRKIVIMGRLKSPEGIVREREIPPNRGADVRPRGGPHEGEQKTFGAPSGFA